MCAHVCVFGGIKEGEAIFDSEPLIRMDSYTSPRRDARRFREDQRRRQCNVENFAIVWLDGNVEKNPNFENIAVTYAVSSTLWKHFQTWMPAFINDISVVHCYHDLSLDNMPFSCECFHTSELTVERGFRTFLIISPLHEKNGYQWIENLEKNNNCFTVMVMPVWSLLHHWCICLLIYGYNN